MVIEIQPLTAAIGAEVRGIDLANDLDDANVAKIREALLEYLVLVFREQDLTPEQQQHI